jgi:septal ring factor EnvC (AmiA/AmiB activator)
MAAYTVKILSVATGVITLGSTSAAVVYWRKACELEAHTQKEKAQWERDLNTLRKTIDWERHEKDKLQKALQWTEEELEKKRGWGTTAVCAGLGCLVGYAMR